MTGVVILLLLAILCLRRANSSIDVERVQALRQASEAETRWKAATERVLTLEKQLVAYMSTVREYRELETQMIQTAVGREDRAVAAVEAVLRSTGCTDAQIDAVVSQIKGEA